MKYDNRFELLIAVVFSMIPKLGGLGPKPQDLVILFLLGEEKPPPYFHLRALAIRSELLLTKNHTGHINKLIRKYIMELSNLKHILHYMTYF